MSDDGPSFMTQSAFVMNWITIGKSGIRINLETGEIEIPDGLSLDDASLAFWKAVKPAFGRS